MIAWALAALAVWKSPLLRRAAEIFTALFLVVELWLLRKIHDESPLWMVGLPMLFIVWINTHGGALAGIGLLGLSRRSHDRASGFTQDSWRDRPAPDGRWSQKHHSPVARRGEAIAALFCQSLGRGPDSGG